MEHVKNTIKSYYHAFNTGQDESLFALMDDKIVHEVNQGPAEVGVVKFRQFMEHMRNCYDEKVYDLIIFSDDKAGRASAEFFVKGIYVKTDPPLPPANGQPYDLRVGAFFELDKGKITRMTTYYNLQDWLKMVKK